MKLLEELLLRDFHVIEKKRIIIYGCGSVGKEAFGICNKFVGGATRYVCAFMETDASKWIAEHGTNSFSDIPILSIEECQNKFYSEDVIIILAGNAKHIESMLATLETKWPDARNVLTWYAFKTSIAFNLDSKIVNENYREYCNILKKVKGKIELPGKNEIMSLFDDNVVVMCVPNRVGQGCMYNSLKKNGIRTTFVHFVNRCAIGRKDYGPGVDELCRFYIHHIKEFPNVKVITMIQDPVVRLISIFCERLWEFGENAKVMFSKSMKNDLAEDRKFFYDSMTEYIQTQSTIGLNGSLFEWYRNEIYPIYGIDVFKEPFNKEQGFAVWEKDNVKILMLTLESVSTNKPVIESFLGVNDFSFDRPLKYLSYPERVRGWRYFYESVLREYKPDNEVMDFYYNGNACMDHFYTVEQKNYFRNRWNQSRCL